MLYLLLFEMDYDVYSGDEVWGSRTIASSEIMFEERYPDNLIPVYKRHKGGYGLVNGLTGEVVIPYQYDWMDFASYYGDFIGVKLSDKEGVIDRKGNVVVPCVYDDVYVSMLSEYGVAKVIKNRKRGLVNTDGDVILPIVYDDVDNYASEQAIIIEKDEKYGFVNLKGKVIIPVEYDDADNFKEGRAGVEVDGKWGFIDKNNNMVIPCKYEWVSEFSNGQATVETFSGERYKIDKQGRRI